MRQDGFSIVEVLVASAIAAALLLIAIPQVLGSKPAAASSAALAVDSAIAKAQAIAATSGNGATLQITADASGTALRLYNGRPTAPGALAQAGPDTQTGASVSEASLGAPPFAVFFDTSGHASAMRGTVDPQSALASDPGCPTANSVTLTISDARTSAVRSLACVQ